MLFLYRLRRALARRHVLGFQRYFHTHKWSEIKRRKA